MTELSELTSNPEQRIQTSRLEAVLNQYELADKFRVLPIEDVGFAIARKTSLETTLPSEESNGPTVVGFDFDDTAYGTSEGVNTRNTRLAELCQKRGLQLTEVQLAQIGNEANQFSKWVDGPGSIDHNFAELASLEWMLKSLPKSQTVEPAHLEMLFSELKRMKAGLTDPESKPHSNDPFRFDANKKKFILTSMKERWSRELENVFVEAFVGTHRIGNIMEAMAKLGVDADSAVFTKGDPVVQLIKLAGTMVENGDMPVSTLLLAKAPKGDVLKKCAAMAAAGKPIPESVRNLFTAENGVFVLVDNNPQDLESVKSARGEGMPAIACVRFKMPGVYKGDMEWEPGLSDGEITFNSLTEGPSAQEVAKVLLDCANKARQENA